MTHTQYSKGSEWRKWDLHVHSPYSHGYSGTWAQFIDQLKSADSQVIGINDYNSVGGYKRLMAEIESGEVVIEDKVFFPVVEMRMTDSVQNKGTKTGSV